LLILLSQYGSSCLPEDNCVSDIDNNGDVGASDLMYLLAYFGSGCPD